MNNYLESTIYTAVRIIGSITPFFLLAVLIFFNGQDPPELKEIIGNGELAIVCITLGIGALYSLINNAYKIGEAVYKTTSYIGLHFIFWPTIFLLMAGVTIYSSGLKDIYLEKSVEKTETIGQESSKVDSPETKNINPNTDESKIELSPAEKGKKRIVTFSVYFFIWIIIAVFVSRMFDKMDIKFVQVRNNAVNDLQNKVEND